MNDPRTNPEHQDDDTGVRLPDEVVDALKGEASKWTLDVPADRSRDILARCREELAGRLAGENRESGRKQDHANESCRRIVPFPGRWTRWAAAAVLVISLTLVIRSRRESALAGINLEKPTVVDAFALARKVEQGPVEDRRFDLDGDGLVNLADANLLAQRAVRLPEGGAL